MNPSTGEILEIAKMDVSNPMDCYKATKTAEKKGRGWRLPTKEELRFIYEQFSEIESCNFGPVNYWSSTEDEEDSDYAYGLGFDDGRNYWNSKFSQVYVRFVRTIGSNYNSSH